MENKTKKDDTKPTTWPLRLTAKAVIFNPRGEVLILQRSDQEKTNRNAYDLPGGTLEKGETISEGLAREIAEETGLRIKNAQIIRISEYPKGDPRLDEIKGLRFVVKYEGDDWQKIKLDKKEHQKFEWLPVKKALEKFSDRDGFEKEKKETIKLAQEWLEKEDALKRWQRCLADFENYKKQSAQQNEEFKKYATENLIVDLLPVLDNFQASLEHIPEAEKESGWVTGILYIQKQLLDILANHGVRAMNVQVGDTFDAGQHEALQSSAKPEPEKNKKEEKRKEEDVQENKEKEGKVDKRDNSLKITKVIKDGYRIGDKVIRPALVETS